MIKCRIVLFVHLFLVVGHIFYIRTSLCLRKYEKQDLIMLREEVREMFEHAYSSYLKYAYPYDELRPLTCDGIDTWGSYSLTLIDALDTLAVMGNYTEFQRVVDIVTANADFDANINVSVFETNIRIVGGLLSAHLLSHRAGVVLEPGWPCNGPLLRLAEDVAHRLLAAFDTPTGMPYGTVNLRRGVPPGETPVTCTAGVGTFILEFGTLSRLTGDPLYEEVAMNALNALYEHRSGIGLFGNHIDVTTGRWTAQDSGIGAGVDSYFEYLVKGALLLRKPELMAMFNRVRPPIDRYLRKDAWYVWASMHKGQVTLPVFQSLEAYWPGVLTLVGDVESALRSMRNYNGIWKQYGFTPEFYNIAEGEAGASRESYPLRPELAESAMHLYRATKDPFLLDVGVNILRSIQHSARTPCGYATIKDARDHTQENRMESFFLAETTKYLYLLFDEDNFIHNAGDQGRIHTLPSGRQCILDAGGYVFNTEAHPLDAGALECCHGSKFEEEMLGGINWGTQGMRGEPLRRPIHETPPPTTTDTPKEDIPVVEIQSEPEETQASKELPQEVQLKEGIGQVSEVVLDTQGSKFGVIKLDTEIGTNRNSVSKLLDVVKESKKEESRKEDDEKATEERVSKEDEPTFVQDYDGATTENTSREPVIVEESWEGKWGKEEEGGGGDFEPQELLEKIRAKQNYASLAWQRHHQLLTCSSQPFSIRITTAAETRLSK